MVRANRKTVDDAEPGPVLVHPLPCWWSIALLLAAGSCDLAFFLTADRAWAQGASWLLLGALIATIPCVLSNLTEHPVPALDRVGATCRVAVVVLCVADLAMRTGPAMPSALAAELTFFAALIGALGAVWPKRWAMPDGEADEVDIAG